MCEEIYEQIGGKGLLSLSEWASYDESKTVDKTIEIALQVNGKLRGTLEIDADASKYDVLAAAKADARVLAQTEGKTIVKEIYVPGKIVNIVVK